MASGPMYLYLVEERLRPEQATPEQHAWTRWKVSYDGNGMSVSFNNTEVNNRVERLHRLFPALEFRVRRYKKDRLT